MCKCVEIIRTERELQELFDEGDVFPGVSIFQSKIWMETWWNAYRDDKTICSGKVLEEGKVKALFPLYVKKRRYFGTYRYREMNIIGTGEKVATDFHDFLVDPGLDDAALSKHLESFLTDTKKEWDEVVLAEFDSGSRIYSAMERFGKNLPFNWIRVKGETCPFQELPDSAEKYSQSVLSRSMKKTLNNKKNKLSRKYGVTFEINGEESGLDERMREFEIQHQARWERKGEEGIFHEPRKAEFLRQISEKLKERGELYLTTLLLDSNPAASMLSFFQNGVLYYYQSAWNEKYNASSVGWICMLQTIESAIRNGATRIEMLRGTEDYKHHFAKSARLTYRVRIFNNNARGRFQYWNRILGVEYLLHGCVSLLDDVTRSFRNRFVPRDASPGINNGAAIPGGTNEDAADRLRGNP